MDLNYGPGDYSLETIRQLQGLLKTCMQQNRLTGSFSSELGFRRRIEYEQGDINFLFEREVQDMLAFCDAVFKEVRYEEGIFKAQSW